LRILLVFCHPAPESFQRTILTDLAAQLERNGHLVTTTDLYRDGFDPVLDAESWRAHRQNRSASADLSTYIEALRETDGLVLVYPTWWYGLPAMIKGWLDRVWQPGVAFAIEDGVFKTHYLAHVNRFAAITTYGSPRWLIVWIIGDPARRQLMRGAALQFARGLRTCWRPIYNVDARSTADLARARRRAVESVVRFFS
jgi:NAD(P)H dehydrogenase (quinone)